LGHAAGLGAADGPELKLDKLEALLGQADGRDAAPLIADLVGLDGSARYGPLDLTPQTQRARTLAVLVDQLLGLATKEPVLVVLEDAHWIDPTTLELIEESLDRIENARVLILLTTRPDHLPALAAHPHVTRLTLNRLGRTGVKAIVERLGGSRLPTDTIDAITARTDGVPLFVEELTKAMLATGEGTIPASLHDSLMARLDRIPEVKEVAQIAACLGREFDFALLALVADRTEGDLGVALEQLVAGELIFRRGTPPEATYSFKHALVCDAAYQSLLKRRRQVVHARVATVLSKQPYDGGATNPEVLAHHFTEAGMPDEALPYWLKAGERATARFALAEAIGHLTKGLELVESMREAPERASFELALLIALGPPLMISKGLYAPEVERLYARAYGHAQQIGGPAQRFATLWGLWHLTHGRADFRSARSLADELLTLAEGQNDQEQLLEAHHAEWTTCFFRGELVSAAPYLAAGRALYEPKAHRSHAFLYGGHDPGTCCRIMNAMILALRGYPEQAVAEGEIALHLAHGLDNPPNLPMRNVLAPISINFCATGQH
jgi:predicted ATPase